MIGLVCSYLLGIDCLVCFLGFPCGLVVWVGLFALLFISGVLFRLCFHVLHLIFCLCGYECC